MRPCLLSVAMAAWAACVVWLPVRAGAQSGADVSPIIPVHPDKRTVLQLPDVIEAVSSADNRDIMVEGVGSELHLLPYPDTPSGVEVFIQVKTKTLHRIFLVRVVENAEDAVRRLDVPAAVAPAPECAEAPPETAALMLSPPTLPEPPATEAALERTGAPGISRFAISVHAVAALGTTAVHVAGYAPTDARRSHRAVGARVAIHPRDTWWAVEGNVTWESLVAPTTHSEGDGLDDIVTLEVDGPRLRADVGLRGRFGTGLMPTFYAGSGLQALHLDIEEPDDPMDRKRRGDLPFEGVLVLGMGLEYRAGNILLGLDLHVRQGVAAEYRSVSGVLSVGFFPDQGE